MYRYWLVLLMVLFQSAGYAQKYHPGVAAYFSKLADKRFPAITLEDENGNEFNSTSLTGKTVYVDVWFTTCPPCLQQIPFAKELKTYFEKDTNIVFLNICIEYDVRKEKWKQLVKDKQIGGINLFYNRNQPQKINLPRELIVYNYPTYYIINKEGKITGYDAPAPSDTGTIHWILTRVNQGYSVSAAYRELMEYSKDYRQFVSQNKDLFR